MRIKIYQTQSENTNTKDLKEEEYTNVYHGDVDIESLSELKGVMDSEPLATYRGEELKSNDIIEVINQADNQSITYKLYDNKFNQIDFDTSKCNELDGMNVVYVTPNNTPINIKIDNTLKGCQNAVKGLIELVYNQDGTLLVCNEESKLIGMQGNRRVNNGQTIIAGPFFICGDDGENFTSLTEDEVITYMDKFREIEDISYEEVQNDMDFMVYGLNFD